MCVRVSKNSIQGSLKSERLFLILREPLAPGYSRLYWAILLKHPILVTVEGGVEVMGAALRGGREQRLQVLWAVGWELPVIDLCSFSVNRFFNGLCGVVFLGL